MEVMAGLSAISQAIDIARAMRNTEKAYDLVALKAQVVDLMDRLQDVRQALQDARDAEIKTEAEIERLKGVLTKRAETIVIGGYRYTVDPEDASKPIGPPFCPRCDEVDKRLILCVDNVGGYGVVCPECGRHYGRGATQYGWSRERKVR